VKRGSQAAELPGKIQFETKPEVVKAGDTFSVAIFIVNEGAQPIQIGGLSLTTVRNGLRSGGAIQPQTKVVAPRQRALLYSTPRTRGRKTRTRGPWRPPFRHPRDTTRTP
jgi:hypothetical protein